MSRTRYRSRVDQNQKDIMRELRRLGATVIDASGVGRGFPDLVVGYQGRTFLLEVKNPERKGVLNLLQEKFFEDFRGEAYVAGTVDEAIEILQPSA
jgi:Holliday junction resolvase